MVVTLFVIPRPVCSSLGPAQNPVIVVEGTPVTFTAQGTVYDGTAPTYTVDFGDGSTPTSGTNSNFVHSFNIESGKTESTYFTYLRISDSLDNKTGDALNCSADCSKIIKVVKTQTQQYCTCAGGTPTCSSLSGTISCTSNAQCTTACSFYCDQGSVTASPSTGKSPLNVTLSAAASGAFTAPLTFKIYDGSDLIKQTTSAIATLSEQLTFTNSGSSVQSHILSISITDSTNKNSTNSCLTSVAVQPAGTGGGGHYECQTNRCVYVATAGTNSCGTDANCSTTPPPPPGSPLTCALTPTPSSGVAPLPVVLTATCQGGYPPYKSYNFDFGGSEGTTNSGINTVQHTYQTIGTYNPSVLGTDSQNQVSPKALAQVLVSSISAVESPFHLKCNAATSACEAVVGTGIDDCQVSDNCQKPLTTPKHFVCNKIRKTCDSYYGAGPNSCVTSSDCAKLNNGFVLPTILVILGAGALLASGLVLIIKRV